MRQLTFLFSGAGQVKWTPERNYTLLFFEGNTTGVYWITSNPSRVSTDLTAPASNGTIEDIIAYLANGSTTVRPNGAHAEFDAGVPIYVNGGGLGSCTLYLR